MEEYQLIFDTVYHLVPPHQEFEIRLKDRCLYRGRGTVVDAPGIAASDGGGHLPGGNP